MNKKGFAAIGIIIVAIIAAVIAGGAYYFVNKKTDKPVSQIVSDEFIQPTTPADWVTIRNKYNPVIESINPISGPVGTVLEIRGKDLWQYNGYNEGFFVIVFKRSDGREVYLESNSFILQGWCPSNGIAEESGLQCDYVELTPGKYKVRVNTAYLEDSNAVDFTVTAH